VNNSRFENIQNNQNDEYKHNRQRFSETAKQWTKLYAVDDDKISVATTTTTSTTTSISTSLPTKSADNNKRTTYEDMNNQSEREQPQAKQSLLKKKRMQ